VYLTGTTTPPANIFSDNSGTVSSNPFTANTTTGYWEFYAPNGRYDVVLSGAGIPTQFTIADILLLDTAVPLTFGSLITFSAGLTSSGPNTLNGGGTTAGAWSHSGLHTFGKINGICIVDGVLNATLAAAVTCAGSSGVIEIPMFAVPTLTGSVTIPAGVTLRFDGPSGITTTGFTLTINGPIVAPPTQIFFGTGTLSIGGLANPLHALWFPGADIIAQIGNAYAASSTNSPYILVDQQSNGACYAATSTANLTTSGKAAIVEGIGGAPISTIAAQTGPCINYTPTTATTAFNVDWTPATGNSYISGPGFRNLILINNNCVTNGGCGSSATAITIGGTNGGARRALWQNVTIMGFGTAWQFNDTNGQSWGQHWLNSTWSHNTAGLVYCSTCGHENDLITNANILVNGTGVNMNGNGQLSIEGGSIDSNTVCAINIGTTGVLNSSDVHYENFLQSNIQYVCNGGVNSRVYLKGGDVLDDTSGGSTAQSFFTFGKGSLSGFNFIAGNGGRTYSSQAFPCSTSCTINFQNDAIAAFPTPTSLCDTFHTCRVTETFIPLFSGFASFDTLSKFWMPESAAPSSNFTGANFDSCYADSTAHAIECSYNNAAFSVVPLVGRAQTWSAAQSFNSGTLLPSVAGGTDLGSASLPFGNLWLGTTLTNNFKFQFGATSGARVVTVTDPVSPTTIALPFVIASGTATMTTAAITAPACGTTVTVAATGVLATDKIDWSFNAAPAGSNAGLVSWPTAGNVNFAYCPGVTETPAAATINWSVRRP
jgi:hypothetical protein